MASEHGWKSPYHLTPAFGRFLGYYVHRAIRADAGDVIYKVPHEWVERPDLLALDVYGDPDLWMAVPLRNNLEDPIYDLTYGREIIVPSITHVLKSLNIKNV